MKNVVYQRKLRRQLEQYHRHPPTLLKRPLNKNEPIAYISSPSLGDTVISMVAVNNLMRNGYQVDVYGDFAYELRNWFPTVRIYPFLPIEEQKKFAEYPVVLHMHERAISQALEIWHPNSIVLYHYPLFWFLMSEVDMQTIVCECQLGLTDVVRDANMQSPSNLINRRYKHRVVIHPTSSVSLKNWPPEKFMQLARILKDKGYDPSFILSINERVLWSKIIADNNDLFFPNFESLDKAAAWIYESGYFIGSDSGVGHLASCMGLPTVSIVVRNSIAKHWKPAWESNEVVLPPMWLNPRPIREKFWKKCTSVLRVVKAFDRLIAKVG